MNFSYFTLFPTTNQITSASACPRAYGNAGSREALGTRMKLTLKGTGGRVLPSPPRGAATVYNLCNEFQNLFLKLILQNIFTIWTFGSIFLRI
jgi:hypothetical protein